MDPERLEKQIGFIVEIDKLKKVLRQTLLTDFERRENSAEHSWHLALMAIFLAEHAKEKVDLPKVVKLVLIHDLVEIDAGDTYCYDDEGNLDKNEREQKAADRIFNLLPGEQAVELRALWDEFEARETPEARFANSLDRFQPLLFNHVTNGQSWVEHQISQEQVLDRNSPIEDGSETLWGYSKGMIDQAVEKGLLRTSD